MITRKISVGNLEIGGDAPISIQTMAKLPLNNSNLQSIIDEMNDLKTIGCDLIRFAVPDSSVLDALSVVCSKKIMPIVADIHFDHKLALSSIKAGVDKIRINPGNIGSKWKIKEVLTVCSDNGLPIRVGVNGGSLAVKFRNMNIVDAMLASAEEEIQLLEEVGFKNAIFSLKCSNAEETVLANEVFASKYDYPIHLGVTEAGPLIPALVKSSVALTRLLDKGIGSTVRISISGEPSTEIKAAREILKACGKYDKGVTLVSCPKCGRATFDNENKLAQKLEDYLYCVDKNITVAVMGCLVNGPGEAKSADIGITGMGSNVVIFKKGNVLAKVTSEDAFDFLKKEIDKL